VSTRDFFKTLTDHNLLNGKVYIYRLDGPKNKDYTLKKKK